MKKLAPFISLLLVVSLLAVTSPAAANHNEPIGEKIRVRNETIKFQYNTPFYIAHGWVQPSTDEAIGVFSFELDVDGSPQPLSFRQFYVTSGDPDLLWRVFVYNFPVGMQGTHAFTGHWFAPCQYAVDWLGYPGTCATPNASVETATRTLTVTFEP